MVNKIRYRDINPRKPLKTFLSLRTGKLGYSYGTLRDGMLGQFTGQNSYRGLNFPSKIQNFQLIHN